MQQEKNITVETFSMADYLKYIQDISKIILEKYPKSVHSVSTDGIVQLKNVEQME